MATKLKIKLLKYNLNLPLENRISLKEVESREKTARMRGNSMALLATIHAELEPKFKALREADDFLCQRKHENQGFVFNHAGEHYSGHIYQTADSKLQEPADLGSLNDPRFALVIRTQELAEKQIQERLKEDFSD